MTTYFTRRENPAPEYGTTYWTAAVDPDGNVRNLLNERDRKLEDMREELQFIRDLSPETIVDVGCGLGWALSALPEKAVKVGIDTDSEAVRLATERAGDSVKPTGRDASNIGRAPNTRLVHGTLRDQQFHANWADAVLMYHVVEHMTEPADELREVYRILKPGGWLVCGTPDFGSAVAQEYGERYRLLHDKTHISLFSSWSLCLLLHDLGFEIGKVRYPYFGTRHHTQENLLRLVNTAEGVSPPAPGSICTVYARKA